jgi:hypothetical protein
MAAQMGQHSKLFQRELFGGGVAELSKSLIVTPLSAAVNQREKCPLLSIAQQGSNSLAAFQS